MRSVIIAVSFVVFVIASDITVVYNSNGDLECYETCLGSIETCPKIICPKEWQEKTEPIDKQSPNYMGGSGVGFPPGMGFPGFGGFPGMGEGYPVMGNPMQYPGQSSQMNGCGCSCQICMPWFPCSPCNCPTTCAPPTTTAATTTSTTTTTTTPLTTTLQEITTSTPSPCQPCVPCMPCFIWWMCPPCSGNCNNGCTSPAPTESPATLPPLNNCPCICAPCQSRQPCNPCPSICPCLATPYEDDIM